MIDLDTRGGQNRDQFDKVCLTYDGQYAIWADGLFVKAARIKDGMVIGSICTHELPVSLQTLDYGYIVVIGREDGHMITAKLVDGENKLPGGFCPTDLKDRTEWLMDKLIYPDGIIATFDAHYQAKPQKLTDAHLPKFTKEMQGLLQEKAKVLHAVIKTASFDNLKELEREKKRRGSSPITHLIEGRCRSKDTSPVSSATHSPATLPRLKKYHKSPSASVEHAFNSGPRHKAAARDRSPSLHDLFNTQKALQNTGSILMALTDVTTTPITKLKKFKRKSSESAATVGSPPQGSPFPARRLNVDQANNNTVGYFYWWLVFFGIFFFFLIRFE